MYKFIKANFFLAILVLFAACSSSDPWSDITDPVNPGGNTDPGQQGGSSSGSVAALALSFDTSALSETETIPTDPNTDEYDDYVEHNTWKNIYTVTYSEGKATVSDADQDSAITFVVDGADVTVNATKKAQYILKGTATDGSFKIYSDSKFEVNLNGLTLTNSDGAAINSQSKKRMFLTCTSGTTNTLCDGTSYTAVGEEDQKGTIFSEGQIIFSGTGSLAVTGKGKNAIASDQYIRIRKNTNIQVTATASNGIKADDITIDGGVQNVSVTAAGGKGIKAENSITVNGGRTIVINTASTGTDSSFSSSSTRAGISGPGGSMNGGPSGQGGGMSGGSSTSLPKGLKADTLITINAGDIRVQCDNGEGIESKIDLVINGGDVFSYCSDDAINTGGKITVNGGRVYAFSTGNDAIDSNYGRSGAFTLNGGTVIGLTTIGGVEEGLDTDENSYITIKSGYLFTAGGQQGGGSGMGGSSTSSVSVGSASQGYASTSGTFASGTYYTLASSDGTNIFTFAVPASISSTVSLISAPEMKANSSYTIKTSTSAPTDAKTTFNNFYFGSSAVGNSNFLTITAK